MKKMKKVEGRRRKPELFAGLPTFSFFILPSSFCFS